LGHIWQAKGPPVWHAFLKYLVTYIIIRKVIIRLWNARTVSKRFIINLTLPKSYKVCDGLWPSKPYKTCYKYEHACKSWSPSLSWRWQLFSKRQNLYKSKTKPQINFVILLRSPGNWKLPTRCYLKAKINDRVCENWVQTLYQWLV